eukprot:2071545-Rhodomonas_salina.1
MWKRRTGEGCDAGRERREPDDGEMLEWDDEAVMIRHRKCSHKSAVHGRGRGCAGSLFLVRLLPFADVD